MTAISERRKADQIQGTPAHKTDTDQWVVLGAGRLGRGFLSVVADDMTPSLRTLLLVAGEKTSQSSVNALNDRRHTGDGYWVEVDHPPERIQLLDYEFRTTVNTGPVISDISDPRTAILSTSVGLDRLARILPLVADGLAQRAQLLDSGRLRKVLVFICENGRTTNGQTASEWFRGRLEDLLGRDTLSRVADFPQVVIDAVIPAVGAPSDSIAIARGTLWVEDIGVAREVISGSRFVELVPASEIALLHTRKLYTFNALHCIISVLGYFAGEVSVDRVARDPRLKDRLNSIVNGLVEAVCRRENIQSSDPRFESTVRYARECLERLRRPPKSQFDRVDRALEKLRDGAYLQDGRLDGPVIDRDLLENPWECPELAHAASLSLYYFVRNIDNSLGELPWLPRRRGLVDTDDSGIRIDCSPIHGQSLLSAQLAGTRLMEVFAKDFLELDRSLRLPWPASRIAKFLGTEIDQTLVVVPKAVKELRCVILDLDEGLVATESILFLVTRGLISRYAKNGRTISHDDYASHVGMSEVAFFAEMVQRFQILQRTPQALVSEREREYRERLNSVDAESLVKPGVRELLALFARKRLLVSVCSNASRGRVQATLEHVGLANYFASCMTPDQGQAPKPSPEMISAIQRDHGVSAAECLVVESSLIGVEAALQAGCFCILLVNDYTAPNRVDRKGVDVLPNSQALREWFREFFT